MATYTSVVSIAVRVNGTNVTTGLLPVNFLGVAAPDFGPATTGVTSFELDLNEGDVVEVIWGYAGVITVSTASFATSLELRPK